MSLYDDELRRAQQFRAQINARNEAQRAYENLTNRAIANEAAQAKQSQGGLGGVLAGIGESIGNVGRGLMGVFGNPVANLRDVLAGKDVNSEDSETQKYNKFLYGGENAKDRKMKAAGTGVDAAMTLLDLVPGVAAGTKAAKLGKVAASPAFQIAQGGLSGLAQEYIDNGQNADMNNALIRAAAGAGAAGAGQAVGSKIAGKIPGNGKIAKALNSNVGRGALTGAASGAVGGGLGTALSGGDLGQTLAGALQGAQTGALGGGAMAGMMGLAGTGIDKMKKKAGVVDNTPSGAVAKRATVQPETPARRGIAITDYDAGEQRVNVRRPNAPTNEYNLGKNAGSDIDGILGPNNARKLRNATQPTDADLLRKQTGGLYDNAADMLYKYPQELETLKKSYPEVYNAVRNGAKEYSDFNVLQFDGTDATGKASLPELNRQQYYEDTIGKLHNKTAFGENGVSAADVPDYMRNHLRNDTTGQLNGRTLRNDEILREFFRGKYGDAVDDMDMNELYGHYEDLAQAANQNETYTGENMKGGILLNDINDDVTGAFVNDLGLRRNIEVGGDPGLRQNIDVAIMDSPSNETVYSKRTLPARNENLPAKATPEQVAPISQETPQITHAERARLEREYTEARQRQGQTLLQQYGVLDAPTRRSVGDPAEVLSTLYDEYGLTNPAEVQYAANHVTGGDGAVSKITRKLASQAEKVDTRIQQGFLDDLMVNAGLSDEEAKTVTKQVVQSLRRAGNSGITDGNTALDIVKQIEGQIRQYKGENGTYHRMTDSESRKVNVLRNVKDEIQGRIWDAAGDPKKVIDTKTLNELKSMFESNKKWENFVDNGIGKAQDGGELRHLMKPLVDGGKIVAGSRMSAGSFADSIVDNARTASGKGLANAAFIAAKNKITNSPKAIQARADKYARQAANANAQLTGGAPVENVTGRLGAGAGAGKIAKGIGNKISGVTKALNNNTLQATPLGDLATRQTARYAGKAAVNDKLLADEQAAAQGAYNDAYNGYATALNNYEMAAVQAQQTTNPGTQQLQTISDAMDRALAAGDMTAYGQLADLYKKAYSIYGTTTTTAEPKALSATQSKALAASQQLDQLETMKPGASTALANSPLGFLVNLGGGDQYANQSKALATTLGYLLSGANIRETEAERIGQAYVPSAFDSEPVRQQKLARARQLIQSYMGSTDDLA